MKHVKQRKKECSLAVCAMLSGAKYSEVQAYAKERYPSRTGQGLYPDQVANVFHYFGNEYQVTPQDHYNAPEMSLKTLTLTGRGYFLYRSVQFNNFAWHIVAFKSGLVYDSECVRPTRLTTWLREKPFFTIAGDKFAVVFRREEKNKWRSNSTPYSRRAVSP